MVPQLLLALAFCDLLNSTGGVALSHVLTALWPALVTLSQPPNPSRVVLVSPDSCDAGNWISSFLRWIPTLLWDYFSKHHLIISEVYQVKQSLEPQNRSCRKLSLMSRSYTPICPSISFPMVGIVCLTSPAIWWTGTRRWAEVGKQLSICMIRKTSNKWSRVKKNYSLVGIISWILNLKTSTEVANEPSRLPCW